MRTALRLARRAYGWTSPNPLVGAVLVRGSRVLGQGWHHRAGEPHAEIEALRDAQRRGNRPRGATLYVTLEPCSTRGRTPPCTRALVAAGIRRVVVGATDPNPAHAGRGLRILERAGIQVVRGVLANECTQLNEAFNHWIVHKTPWVIVKAAMTLDGKIATAQGESKWITSTRSRERAMKIRAGVDAILVGVNTVRADDPQLTLRGRGIPARLARQKRLRRIVLDPQARIQLTAQLVSDVAKATTTVVVTSAAPKGRVRALRQRVEVLEAPVRKGRIDLRWLLRHLGAENVTSVLVEGGAETHAAFLEQRLVQRVAFFYAPKVIGGRQSIPGVGGAGAGRWADVTLLRDVEWHRVGPDLFLTAKC